MSTTQTTSVKPLENAKETLLGMINSIERTYGCTPMLDTGTTLNTKFNVFPSMLPNGSKVIKYFTMGVGGRVNDDSTLSSAQYALGTNMSLYMPLPFRAVAVEEDLEADVRANYALRQIRTINGTQYALYYAKKIEFTESQVQMIRRDPTTGVSTEYQFNYNNLTPTPPTSDSNGVVVDVADSVSAILPGTITITGEEVLEAVSVLYGGDPRYAIVSEIGFISSSPKTVQVTDANNNPFSYTEAIFAQLADQYNWVGMPFMSTQDVFKRTINFSMRSLINT